MSHDRMESPLELPIFIPYRPSRRVALFTTLVHAGAILCLFLTELPLIVSGLPAIVILVHYSFYLRRFLSPQPVSFKLDRYQRWQLLQEGKEAVDLKLLPGGFVHPRVVALCFKEPAGRTRFCVLTDDNLDEQTLRRLRVRLRWEVAG